METPLTGAFVVGRIRIRDAQRWIAYRDAVPATLVAWGGEIVARGRAARLLAGTDDDGDCVVLRFPSLDAVDGWYASDAYRAIVPLRDAAADVTLVAYRT